jgi:hypothetical protein
MEIERLLSLCSDVSNVDLYIKDTELKNISYIVIKC